MFCNYHFSRYMQSSSRTICRYHNSDGTQWYKRYTLRCPVSDVISHQGLLFCATAWPWNDFICVGNTNGPIAHGVMDIWWRLYRHCEPWDINVDRQVGVGIDFHSRLPIAVRLQSAIDRFLFLKRQSIAIASDCNSRYCFLRLPATIDFDDDRQRLRTLISNNLSAKQN